LDFQQELVNETDHIDNLLVRLRQYYDDVRTKRQLQMEMPAGFRRSSEFQKLRHLYLRNQQLQDDTNDGSTPLFSRAGPDALQNLSSKTQH